MTEGLKNLLKKGAVEYSTVPSKLVPNNPGEIIALENYYPGNNIDNFKVSIALSLEDKKFARKCWLSVKIGKPTYNNGPKYKVMWRKFEYHKIKYYPYSINTGEYSKLQILNLCNGLYKFCNQEINKHNV